jgi:hypothetical protein
MQAWRLCLLPVLFYADFSSGSLFKPEDGDDMFLRKVD